MKNYLAMLGLVFAFAAPSASADPTVSQASREEMQDAYAKQLRNTPSFFSDAPIYQIVPSENNITFAGEASYKDVTVGPAGSDISKKRTNLAEHLDYTGWSVSPYVAFSGKNFAIGFTGTVGSAKSHYLNLATTSTPYTEQYSEMSYSGVGGFVYYTPSWLGLPKDVTLTVLGGVDSINVVQDESGTLVDQSAAVDLQKYRYSVQNYTGGINMGIRLAKRFTIIPWVDYSTYVVGNPTLASGAASGLGTDDTALKDNVNLYWHSQPSLRYGLDFAIRVFGLDIHFGGLLGVLGNINKGNDRIQDNSESFSISFNMKGA